MGKTKNSSPLIQNPKAFSKTIAKTKPKKEKEPDQFQIEEIVDSKIVEGKKYYLIKWMNYSHQKNTWQQQNLPYPEFVRQYERKRNENKINNSNIEDKEESSVPLKKQIKKKVVQKQTKLTFFTKSTKSINQKRQQIQQISNPSKILKSSKNSENNEQRSVQNQKEREQDIQNLSIQMDEEVEEINAEKEKPEVQERVLEEQSSQNMMIIEESARQNVQSQESSDPFGNEKDDSYQAEQKIKTEHQGVNKTKELQVRKSKRRNCLRRQGLDQKNVVTELKKERGQKKMKLKKQISSDVYSEKSVQLNSFAQFEEKNFNDMLDLEKGLGKKVEYQFKRDGLKMYKIRLVNNSEIVLSEEHARLYFPRLIIDYYKDVLGFLANCSGE